METKATNLERLKTVVTVPDFMCVKTMEGFILKKVPQWSAYIVRGVSAREDGKKHSHAGQFVTHGPLSRGDVSLAVEDVFQDTETVEVIVQEYVRGPSGVAFCLADGKWYIEYSAIAEGVTSGSVRPFVALLPTSNGQYVKLSEELRKIYRVFGPCDVEFIDIENPQFVQVRPITKEIVIDEEFTKLKMTLQHDISGSWHENDLAHAIAEHGGRDALYAQNYIASVTRVMRDYFDRDIDGDLSDVINVGSQYYVSERFMKQSQLGFSDIIKCAFVFYKERGEIENFTQEEISLEELFRRSILVSMAHSILKKKGYFVLREKYREVIDKKLRECDGGGAGIARYAFSRKLDETIALSDEMKVWNSFSLRDHNGQCIVEGDLDFSKARMYKPGDVLEKGDVVLCENLYSEIGQYIDSIGGIICANGSVNSHIAILCREYTVPLMIHVDTKNFDIYSKRC